MIIMCASVLRSRPSLLQCSWSCLLFFYTSCPFSTLVNLQNAYRGVDSVNVTSEIWLLLWAASSSSEYRARLCAVEWACDLFNFSDVAARRLCVTLCDDKVTAVQNSAARGLQPAGGSGAADARLSEYPTFGSFVLGALRDGAMPATSVHDLSPAALARALNFALECRRMQTLRGGDEREDDEAIAVFLSLIEATLRTAPSATDGQHSHAQVVLLHRSAAVAMKKLAAGDSNGVEGSYANAENNINSARKFDAAGMLPVSGLAAKLASRGPWLQQWLGHESSTEIRESFAATTGAAAEFMDPNAELVPLLRALGLKLKVS